MNESDKPKEETAQERYERHLREKADREALHAAMYAQHDAQMRQKREEEIQAINSECKEWTEDVTCTECQVVFSARMIEVFGAKMGQKICSKCSVVYEERQRNEEIEAERKERWRSWVRMIPDDYLETDVSRCERELIAAGVKLIFSDGNGKPRELTVQAAMDMIQDWPSHGPGLALIGETGRCKTRLMLHLLGKYHMAGCGVAFVNSATMADEIGEQFSQSSSAGNAYLRRLEMSPILFIDDLGKGKLTDRSEEALYRIVESRKSHKRRTFFSANCIGSQLEARLSPDRGAPIVRRLREMAHAIAFIEQKPRK